MDGRLLLKDCSLFRADGRVRTGMSVLIEGGAISQVSDDAALPPRPGDWAVRCGGRLVTPGFVDCHTRLVNAQLAPWAGHHLLLPLEERYRAEAVLDARLTVSEVEALTAAAIGRGLLRGTTMFVEHLHAPACVEEGLSAQARVARRLGARLLNSHASSSTTDSRPGPAQVEANARYVASTHQDPLVRASLGVAASFAADDELLRVVGRLKEELGVGCHFRLAESDEDLALTWARHHTRIANRFETFGILGGASIGAHARAIDRTEAERLARTRTLVALSPRLTHTLEGGSALGMEAVLLGQNLVGLGTGGAGTLWEELAASFTGVMTLARSGRMLDPDNLMATFLVSGPAELCTMVFGQPSGGIDVGALADLVVHDFVPAQESSNYTPHLLMQLSQTRALWTIVQGQVVVREGQLLATPQLGLEHDAARAVEAVWKRA
ncbi:MAG: amidohydrolase family protein [Myxococcaceae bacterium]|nr:amidohydrolase family protein [Myxococcaceae bacterium]